MVVNLFRNILGNPQTLLMPWVKTNQALAANIEELAIFQINALKSCLNIQIYQLRAAAEITDLASLRDFWQRQIEIAKTVHQKMLSDATVLSDIAARFKTEVDDLTQTALEELAFKAA